MADYISVCKKNELVQGQCKSIEVKGQRVALFNVEGNFYAIDDTCAHRGGPLGEGELDGQVVSCPWHGWQFDVKTGQCTINPSQSVKAYTVKVEGEEVFLEV